MSTGKLATIVAVDVAGYSALAQANESAAVAAVARLGNRCAKAAKAHGGRVFNTSGDAVMMEFSSVEGALEAADELVRDPDPPIRIGIHRGEVRATPGGDLLGEGVSVAARLQALAEAGGVIVSADARRALHGPMTERLAAKGVIKLDKVDESIGIYELVQDSEAIARSHAAHRAARATRTALIVGLGAVGVVLLAALAWPVLRPPAETRVAVFPMSAPANDAGLAALSADLAEDISLSLNAAGVQAISHSEPVGAREERIQRARDQRAALMFDGAAERSGGVIRITVNVVRTSDSSTLWSDAIEGDADAPGPLRLRAAERSADVLACGAEVRRRRRARPAAETFALLLRGCALARHQDTLIEAREALVQVVEREPRFAFARGLLAFSSARASAAAPAAMAAQLRESARAEAERALRIDRSVGESYVALSLLENRASWAVREDLLREGLSRDELNGALNTFYAMFLADVGRTSEALAFAQRGAALDPLSRPKRRNVAGILMLTGDAEAAREIVETMAFGYPDDARHWRARMHIAFWSGRYDDAVDLLMASASEARSPRQRACWRQSADAMRAARPAPQAAARVLACYENDDLPPAQTLMMLAALGDLDAAFALARAMFVDMRMDGQDVLFAPATAPLRADPRFLPLMRDMGLLRYWQLSGRWPDFCRDRDLPYRCEAEAARLI